MPISEAKKRANRKYDIVHLTTIGCRLKKQEAADFKAYAESQGKTANALLKEYVMDCIKPKAQ